MEMIQGDSFQKELKKLKKRYRSLPEDLKVLEKLILKFPQGEDSRHCNALKKEAHKCICKRRMMCRSGKGSEFRVVYFYDGKVLELMYLEIYFKGDKTTEDSKRIETFWKEKLEAAEAAETE
ncbi:MAG TPA: hypothetical protein DCX06_10660 [Opitutae bacterium]|jgi:hypothetical protein|nr:hypothetical protein [Opitutae bacterium]